MQLDTSSEFGARVAKRLQDESVIWLTTVRADGRPQPNPVWFYWDGEAFLHYSQPKTQKIRNIQRNPHVALHLNSDDYGGNVVVVEGTAEISSGTHTLDAYVAKYREAMASLQMTPEEFAKSYSLAIRVTPASVRGH